MQRHKIAINALLSLLLLAGCSGNAPDIAYSQPRAISADIDASLHHGPTATDLTQGIRFNDDLDAVINNRPTAPRPAFGIQ